MADIFEVTTDVLPEQTIVVPEQVTVPDIRWAAPSGTLAQGDILYVAATLKDMSGNPKYSEFPNLQVVYKDWPSDPTKEILGVFYLNHVVSTKAPVPDSTQV